MPDWLVITMRRKPARSSATSAAATPGSSADVIGPAEVAAILDQGAVAVKKHRRAQCGLRHCRGRTVAESGFALLRHDRLGRVGPDPGRIRLRSLERIGLDRIGACLGAVGRRRRLGRVELLRDGRSADAAGAADAADLDEVTLAEVDAAAGCESPARCRGRDASAAPSRQRAAAVRRGRRARRRGAATGH